MIPINRRNFLKAGASTAALGSATWLTPPAHAGQSSSTPTGRLHFLHDGLLLSPLDQVKLLEKLVNDGKAKRDSYLAGGSVQELETTFAKVLGKERALFVPTGTLANHLALRHLSQGKTRVIVQAESHIYCDSSDCVQTLSHLNLVPLGIGQATINQSEIEDACKRSMSGPFPLPVGAISLECPVRRQVGQAFDFQEMKRIADYAQKQKIKLHLDGARLFVASAFKGVSIADYSALFDTVYISLYKCFNAGTGAILAGPKDVIEAVAHDRKVFGSSLYQAWHYAAVALHYLDGYTERYQRAVNIAKELFTELEKHPQFKLEHPPQGTNIFKLRIKDVAADKYQQTLAKNGVLVNRDGRDYPGVLLVVNESLNMSTAPKLAKIFIDSLPT